MLAITKLVIRNTISKTDAVRYSRAQMLVRSDCAGILYLEHKVCEHKSTKQNNILATAHVAQAAIQWSVVTNLICAGIVSEKDIVPTILQLWNVK